MSDGVYDIVILGDSFSAGNGAGSYYGAEAAYRSTKNWGNRYAELLRERVSVPIRVTVLAHSGITSSAIFLTALFIPAGADLVMMTIGGNDVGFSDVIKHCYIPGFRSQESCQKDFDTAKNLIPTVGYRIEQVLLTMSKKSPASARFVVVGYPYLSYRGSWTLEDCTLFFFNCKEIRVADRVRELGDLATEAQRAAVERYDIVSGRGNQWATYVPMLDAFAGREPLPQGENGRRWINSWNETEGVQVGDNETEWRRSWDAMEWYHPGITGHQKMAEEIFSQIRVPAELEAANTALVGHPAAAPFANLDPVAAATPGDTVTFDASGSEGLGDDIVSYAWDFDGDGTVDNTTVQSLVEWMPTAEFSGTASVTVTRADGATSTSTAQVDVTGDGDVTAEAGDNCPDVANWSQVDSDSDGIGDDCDTTPGVPTIDSAGTVTRNEDGLGQATAPLSGTRPVNTAGTSLTVTIDPDDSTQLQISATGFPAGATVEAWHLEGARQIASIAAQADGTVQTTLSAPGAPLAVGQTVVLGEPSGDVIISATVTAAVKSNPAPNATLAATGTDLSLAALTTTGGVGVAFGALILFALRRRRSLLAVARPHDELRNE